MGEGQGEGSGKRLGLFRVADAEVLVACARPCQVLRLFLPAPQCHHLFKQ